MLHKCLGYVKGESRPMRCPETANCTSTGLRLRLGGLGRFARLDRLLSSRSVNHLLDSGNKFGVSRFGLAVQDLLSFSRGGNAASREPCLLGLQQNLWVILGVSRGNGWIF